MAKTALLTEEHLKAVDLTLYKTKKDELVARQIARVNTNYESFAESIEYGWYDQQGSAEVLSNKNTATDIPFVSEHGGKEIARVYTLATGVRYSKQEVVAALAKRNINLETTRTEAARRFIATKENDIFFNGLGSHNLQGLLNKTGIVKEAVKAVGGKTSWAEKDAKAIYADLHKAKEEIEKDGYFTAKMLLIDPVNYNRLLQPYGESGSISIMKLLQNEGLGFEKIIKTNILKSANNVLTKNAFVVLDNDPQNLELAVPEDLTREEPLYDILGNVEMAITQRTAGAIIRHPSAIYVGTF